MGKTKIFFRAGQVSLVATYKLQLDHANWTYLSNIFPVDCFIAKCHCPCIVKLFSKRFISKCISMVESNELLSFPTVSRTFGFSSGYLLNRFAMLLAELTAWLVCISSCESRARRKMSVGLGTSLTTRWCNLSEAVLCDFVSNCRWHIWRNLEPTNCETVVLWSRRISDVGESTASTWRWGGLRSSYRPGYEVILQEGVY